MGPGGKGLKVEGHGKKSIEPTNQKKKHQSWQFGIVARISPHAGNDACGFVEGVAFDHILECRWRTAATNDPDFHTTVHIALEKQMKA